MTKKINTPTRKYVYCILYIFTLGIVFSHSDGIIIRFQVNHSKSKKRITMEWTQTAYKPHTYAHNHYPISTRIQEKREWLEKTNEEKMRYS